MKDVGLGDLFSPEFLERFEVHSYRNAARIISAAGADEFREVIDALTSFSIRTYEVVKPGGSKTDIAKRLEELMAARGWFECRISGDLHVRKTIKEI